MKKSISISLLIAFSILTVFTLLKTEKNNPEYPSAQKDKNTKTTTGQSPTIGTTNSILAVTQNTDTNNYSIDEWRKYKAGEISLDNLSESNRKRALQSKRKESSIKDREQREKIQNEDIKENRNSEVRERENELRSLSEKLYKGMDQARMLETMGLPSKIGQSIERSFYQNLKQNIKATYPDEFKKCGTKSSYTPTIWQDVAVIKNLPAAGIQGAETIFIYSPHPSDKIHYNMGDSFQYLQIWCNNQDGKITDWKWTTPMISR